MARTQERMADRKMPLFYLLLEHPSNGDIRGNITDGRFEHFWYFEKLSQMTEIVNLLLKDDSAFYVEPITWDEMQKKECPRYSRLLVVEIRFRDKGDWQGLVYGIHRLESNLFSGREELCSLIKRELFSEAQVRA